MWDNQEYGLLVPGCPYSLLGLVVDTLVPPARIPGHHRHCYYVDVHWSIYLYIYTKVGKLSLLLSM